MPRSLTAVAVLAGLLLAQAGAAAAADPGLDAAAIERVDTAMNGFVAGGVPGLAIGIVQDGRLAYAQGYGVMDRKTGRKVTATTRMEIGSVTKQFTAAAILQLQEAGRLSLDDELGKFVPEYAAGRDLTLRQLLWQVSGVPEYVPNDPEEAEKVTRETPSVERILGIIEPQPLEFPPGTRWAYRNTNYFLLGLVIERVSGLAYDDYVRRKILEPAGLRRTATMAKEGALDDFATGYMMADGVARATPPFGNLWAYAAGDLVTDVGDLAAWDAAFFGGKVVSPASVALITAPGHLADGKPTIYGMGWVVGPLDGQKAIWHSGGSLGFGATNAVFPDLHLTLLVLLNTTATEPGSVTTALLEALRPDIKAAKYTPGAGEDPAVTKRVGTLVQALQAGTLAAADVTAESRERLTPAAMAQVQGFLRPLGAVGSLVYKERATAGDVVKYTYLVRFASGDLRFTLGLDGAGRLGSLDIGD